MEQTQGNLKVKVQQFGSFLSGMIMPNIGAFIAWGILTALFIPTGWFPNEQLNEITGPTITYLLPILIGFTGGRLVYDIRGGVVGAMVTMGVITGADIPMFLGAMMVGPAGAYCIKKFDQLVDGKIKPGFEMLVNNFSSGILASILAIIAYLIVGPAVEGLNNLLATGVGFLVENSLLPLASVFVEPAKVLFLNNAINHGVISPIAIEQAAETGRSVLFLLESNPGPGLGILLAYTIFGRGSAKQTAPGAIIIHFLGGIHEIYFPYILMKPILILSAIGGGMAGVMTFSLFNAGLVAPASPGSIFAILAMTPRNGYLGVFAGIIVATAVSFAISAVVLKTSKETETTIEAASEKASALKGRKTVNPDVVTSFSASEKMSNAVEILANTKKIIFACDAGMGSSAMGASVLRNKVKKAGLTIEVVNSAIAQLPNDADIVVTHQDLTSRAKERLPKAYHVSVDNFLSSNKYDELVEKLLAVKTSV
ncbi:PTS mannitol transporter subunit IIBC [Enterococcus ureilyticus]|uniref:PTS system mannitol-specific EIICB component n=1 Tax=Enterococcus ureilyticus TaxID=1131292 RepID=A0A1E5HDR0_9ENTE|nr:PTS mannitol transporter subunit IICBA [Enterococcus ureilyticus]MBM7690035.1 PTS system mannitol-specific IIC component [Enterococcus ureilyticus]OEG22986.1 PTS mannitol transporter subunit IIBC [Enterococcus ureilyticus]